MRGHDAQSDRGVEEVEFTLSDATYPFVGISADEECDFTLQKMLPRGGGAYAEFFSVAGIDPTRVVDRVTGNDLVESQVIASHDAGGLVEFTVQGGCPARDLAELGAIPQEVTAQNGEGVIVAEVLPGQNTVDVVADFLDNHPTVELRAKRETDRVTPIFTPRGLDQVVDDRLTDRQREVLTTAYEAGYYERPRDTTGEELAARLDIAPSTFTQHIRAAERNLLSILYDRD